LVHRVVVKADTAMSLPFPREVPARVSIELYDGRRFTSEKRDYLGFWSRPMSWDGVVDKFRQLTQARVARDQGERIVTCVARLEHLPVAQLFEALEASHE
jgi:2-methylcitrate dehydratase